MNWTSRLRAKDNGVQKFGNRASLYGAQGIAKPMSEPPGSDPLQGREASLEDIRREFQALTAAEWGKLAAHAESRVRVVGVYATARDACHLSMQAKNSLAT